jgi:hypothetical protein
MYREMIDSAIPRNVHFLTFDEILARIEARLPAPLAFHALVRSDADVDYDASWTFTISRMTTCTYSGQEIATGALRVEISSSHFQKPRNARTVDTSQPSKSEATSKDIWGATEYLPGRSVGPVVPSLAFWRTHENLAPNKPSPS